MKNIRAWAIAVVAGVLIPAALWAANQQFSVSPSTVINCESGDGCNITINQVAPVLQSEEVFGGTTGLDSLRLKNDLTVEDDVTITGGISLGGGSSLDFFSITTSTVNPNSIAAGGVTSTVVALTGASVGDSVKVSGGVLWHQTTSTVNLTGYVSAADTVTVQLFNFSATSGLDLASEVMTVEVTSKLP